MPAQSETDLEQIRTREDLARRLTELRTDAGLTVRELASRLDAPVATIGDYFSGRHLPGARQVPLFEGILDACGVRDRDLVGRWVAALTRVRLATDGRGAKGPAPYRGLDPFTEADADLFFGRRAAVDEVLRHLRRARDANTRGGAIAVVGASGSGKTSLLLAGVVPAVRSGALDGPTPGPGGRWDVVTVTAEQLATNTHELEPTAPGVRRLVVVDQLEAGLTLPPDRRSALLDAVAALQETCLVVVGLRADFYQAAVAEPVLLPALRNQVILGPMTADELREAIVEPVRRSGAGIDEALVDLILVDLSPGSPPGFAHEPGSLPFLSYALLATWDHAPHNRLTIADYQAVGGLRGAVRQAAEAVYGQLDEDEREQARRIFARLVRVDDDGPPTRRRATRQELTSAPPDASAGTSSAGTSSVLERFVAARLLTADAERIQISHEALLGAWPRLGDWVGTNRDWLRVHHQVADAARAWSEAGHDESLLWRGLRLEEAADLAADPLRATDLNRVEDAFLSRSSDQQRAEERARHRRARRTHQLLGAVALLAAAAIVFAAIAVDASVGADHARNQALSRQVAVEAQQLQPTDPSLAAQLALAAYRISPTVQASSRLLDATAGEIPTRLLGPVGPVFVSATANGHILAVAQSATDTVALYRLPAAAGDAVELSRVTAGPASDQDFAVAVSPDGKLLAAGGTGATIRLWSIADPTRPRRLATLRGLKSTVYSLAFAPDGQALAAADAAGTVDRWAISTSGQPADAQVLPAPGGAAMKAIAYSPDGKLLAAAGGGGALAVWRTGDPQPAVATGTAGTDFQSVAFGPSGTELAVGSGNNHTVDIWLVGPTGQLTLAHGPFAVATSEVNSTVFSPDGSVLAEASADGTLQLYDTRTWTSVASFSAPDPITSLVFTRGGRALASADSGGVTRIWQLPSSASYLEPGSVYSLSYTKTGRYLVDSSSGANGGVTIWSDANPLHPTRLVDVAMPAGFGPAAGVAAISPDGRLLAVGNTSAEIQLFDLADIRHPVPLGRPLHGNHPYIEQLSFTPDGKLLMAGDDSGQVRAWNVSHPAHPRALPTISGPKGQVLGFSFTPDSKILATASSDGKVRVYDVADPEHTRLLATLGGFASYVYDTTITPDGRTLIAGSAGGTIRLWDITDPSRPRPLGAPQSIPTGYVFQLAVSPDGHTLAAASTAAAVWLWNIADPSRPQLLDTLASAHDEVFTVRFDPAGGVLAASGSDDTVHFWDAQPAEAASRVCTLAGAPITRREWAQYVQGAGYRPPCR